MDSKGVYKMSKEPTNFNSRLDEIYIRSDVSNNGTDDPLSQDEFRAEITQLLLEIIVDETIDDQDELAHDKWVRNELRQQLRDTVEGKK